MLAERDLRVETALYQPEFASWPPDERLAAEFHRRICHALVPDWAGRWRTIEVGVGKASLLSSGSAVTNASARLKQELGTR